MDLLSSAATIRDSSSSLLSRHVHHPNNYRLVHLLLLFFLLGVVSLAAARLGPSHFTAATLTLRLSLTVTRGVFVGGGEAGGGGSASKCVKRCHSGEPAQEVAESLRYAHCHNIMIES